MHLWRHDVSGNHVMSHIALALNLPAGKTTVMHLVVREGIPGEGSSHGKQVTCYSEDIIQFWCCRYVGKGQT